jgi:ABC-type lipoprotein release transport system permease subunit
MFTLQTEISKRFPRTLFLSALRGSLQEYERALTLARVPLFLFTWLIVGVVLYFLAIVIGLEVQARGEEVALVRSRGASALQASALMTLGEGVLVSLLALVIGPFMALAIVGALLVPTLNPVGVESAPIPVALTPWTFAMSAIAAVLALLVFVLASRSVARLGLAEFLRERARPPGVSLLHRYYLDILLIGSFALLWWQARSRGGFITEGLLGGLKIEPSLLLAPLLALLGLGLVLLRFLPALMRGLSALVDFVGTVWASVALKRLARDPLPYGLLAVMVMAAAALGIFGTTFSSTLARSRSDQALYAVGANVVVNTRSSSGEEDISAELATITGVKAVSPVRRTLSKVATSGAEPQVKLLAVNPATFAETTWFRKDFAPRPLSELMDELRYAGERQNGILLPADAESISLWLRVAERRGGLTRLQLNVWARVLDAGGFYRNVELGTLPEGNRWTLLEGKLPGPGGGVKPPFSLVSVFFSGGAIGFTTATIHLDDIAVTRSNGSTVIVDGFETRSGWTTLPQLARHTLDYAGNIVRSGSTSAVVSWNEAPAGAILGMWFPPGSLPLQAIGGPTFAKGGLVNLNLRSVVLPLEVKEVASHFPTLDPRSENFLIVNIEEYDQFLKRLPVPERAQPNEFWVGLAPWANQQRVINTLEQRYGRSYGIRDRGEEAQLAQRDPLRAGGWKALSLLGTVVLGGVVLLGLSLYGALAVHKRRVELTVVRALGISRLQLSLGLLLEVMLTVLLGIGVGSAVGWLLGRWTLGFLDITPSGRPLLPPMVLTVDTGLLIFVLVSLFAAALLAVVFTIGLASRLKTAEVLREGEQ